jgi:peptidyl-prolyl cis-trans isomerase B (cyclophilin B)
MKKATLVTSKGTLVAELYDTEAPDTVANFEKLANSGFYDGTRFHRVIPDFVVQGGDPYSKGGEHAKGPVGTGGLATRSCETAGNLHGRRALFHGPCRQGHGRQPSCR